MTALPLPGEPFGPPPTPRYHQRPKLTPAQRDEIRSRRAGGESVADLAAEFGVSTRTIRTNS